MRILLIVVVALTLAALAGYLMTLRESAASEAANPPDGHMVLVSGGRLHLVDTGPEDAPPERTIVLIHGASANHLDMMLALGDKLKEHYRVIAPDRPGHGWSERPDGRADSSPARQATLIAEALEKRGVKRAIFVVHSWSGALGGWLALNRPDLVAGMVMLAPVTHPWPGGVAWYYGVTVNPWVGNLFTNVLVTPIGSLSIESGIGGVFTPQAPPPDYGKKIGARLLLRPAEFRANAEDVYDLLPFVTRQARDYEAIKVPLTIIAGDADPVVSTQIHSMALAKQVEGSKLIVLPGMGHMPHHMASELVIKEIDAMSDKASKPAVHATAPE